jgi:hypothetical protein
MNLQWIFILTMTTVFAGFAIADPQSESASIEKLAQSPAWKKMLHYKKNMWGSEKSLVDGAGFFFSPKGATDPLAEMAATIEAFRSQDQKVGIYKIHPQCAFPARLDFLKRHLQLTLPDKTCPQLEGFLQTFSNVQNVSIVFSSAYIQNPASMFGHTFLKINKKNGTPLRDIGINYAAKVPPDENSFAFIYFGVNGGYVGQWSTENYYDKVREYSQGENRDLWEYEIDLSPQETLQLVKHLWEIETNSFFNYYFFDENCSYQILAAIEAVRPEWNLLDHKIYFIPGESLKNLFIRPDIVKSVNLRPSQYRQVAFRFEKLNPAERRDFFSTLQSRVLSPSITMGTLETLMAYMDYLNIKRKGRLTEDEKSFHTQILVQRSSFGAVANVVKESEIPAETRADLGHDSYAFSLEQTVREREDGFGVGGISKMRIRSSYHDLMNNDRGYKRFSQIEFPTLEMAFDSDLDRVRLNSATFLSITSLSPMNFLSRSPAWKLNLGLNTVRDYGCLTCRHLFADLGVGAAMEASFGSSALFYGLATFKNEFYRQLDRGHHYGPGINVGALVGAYDTFKFHLSFDQYFLISETQNRADSIQTYLFQTSYFFDRNLEFRWTSQWIRPQKWSIMEEWSNSLAITYFFK